MQRLYDLVYLSTHKTFLGESPIWHPEFSRFYWTDHYASKLLSLEPISLSVQDHEISSDEVPDLNAVTIAPMKGGFVAAFKDHVGTIDMNGQVKLANVQGLEALLGQYIILNDGKCSPNGEFFVGSLDTRSVPGKVNGFTDSVKRMTWLSRATPFLGTMERNPYLNTYLYKIADGKATKQDPVGHIFISNGPSWSLDGTRFYFVCSAENKIKEYEFDRELGMVTGQPRVVKDLLANGQLYDGSTVDSKGYLWWAIYNGGRVIRIDPKTGSVVLDIPLKMKMTTHLTFGGDDYRTLLVTSARRVGYSPDLLEGENGGVAVIKFTKESGIQGVPPNMCNGL